MANQRRFSRERHRIKLNEREEVEKRIKALLVTALREEAPTTTLYAIDVIAEVAATISSQLISQTQVTHRTLSTMKDDAVDYATEFVVQFLNEARKDVHARFKRHTAAPPAEVVSLSLADDWAGPVAGPTDIERHFGIPRSTLYRWQKRSEVIVLNTRSTSKPVFPLRQFQDGRPARGIAEVIAIFSDIRAAWQWLVGGNADSGDIAPIDKLLAGSVEDVLSSASEYKMSALERVDAP